MGIKDFSRITRFVPVLKPKFVKILDSLEFNSGKQKIVGYNKSLKEVLM